jgi:ClpP class serine protease
VNVITETHTRRGSGLHGTWLAPWDDAMHVVQLDRLAADVPEKFRELPSPLYEDVRDEDGRKIAVLSVDGHVVTSPSPASRLLGMVSYIDITERLNTLVASESVDGVLLAVETFGGAMLEGLTEAAAAIARAAKQKPIVAYLSMAGPVGLALAAGASSIVMPAWSWAGPMAAHRVNDTAERVPMSVTKPIFRQVAHARRVPVDIACALRRRCRPGELLELKLIDEIGGEAAAIEGLLRLIREAEAK